jgi:tetratricopeptide (TPR) repeat protein
MYCPECGHEASEAKFCPECGTNLTTARQAARRSTRQSAGSSPARAQRPRAARRAAERRGQPAPAAPAKSRSPLPIWLGVAALTIVAVVTVIALGSRSGQSTPTAAAEPIAADTSGSYSALVDRGNGLYDQGIEAFNKNDDAGGEAYFKAASQVYRAAWKKQPGDPNVGTDLAVALFYMRHHDEGLKQIEVVIKKNPGFQVAHLNKGIFLQTEASEATDKAKAADYLAEAKVAFQKAVSIDPASEAGKHAAEVLRSL